MDTDLLTSLVMGAGTTLAIASPAEWLVHKYILHAPPKLRRKVKFIEGASRGHNDNHHGAYHGPAHYYRDSTNQKEIIHFSKGDVGVIAGFAALVGGAVASTYSLIQEGVIDLREKSLAYVTGAVAGAMLYYGAYEIVHHHMHVLGKQRMDVHKILGDYIQGGSEKSDGKLRLSKPLLDDICEEVMGQSVSDLDLSSRPIDSNLISRIEQQLDYNRKLNGRNTPLIEIAPGGAKEVLDNTAKTISNSEREYTSSLGTFDSFKHAIGRKARLVLRNSGIFDFLDRHHFLHHVKYGHNLNVVCPVTDTVMGTKIDSSREALENDPRYWLCPNSPDVKPFERILEKKELQNV